MKVKSLCATGDGCPSLRLLAGLGGLAALLLSSAYSPAAVPADPAVELRFPEGPSGNGANITNTTSVISTNTGTLSGFVTLMQDTANSWETNTFPAFTNNVPSGTYVPANNDYSMDMGPISGNSSAGYGGRALDSTTSLATIGAFEKLTICGWANANALPGARSLSLVYAFETVGASGFDLQENLDGTIGLFINGYENDPAYSTVRLSGSSSYASNNWIFFAVTYDPTLAQKQLKYFFGRPDKLAALDVAADYVPASSLGAVVTYTGALNVGNVSTLDGARNATGSVSHQYRGLIDEVKIYTNALSIDEIQQAQVNSAVAPAPATFLKQPVSATAQAGNNATFTCEANGSGDVSYQWRTNGVPVAGATGTSFTLPNVQLSDSGKLISVVISNAAITPPGLASTNATLSVIPADPKIVSFSFSSTAGVLTPNMGSIAGSGRLRLTGGLPLIITSNSPTGPFAPSAAHNFEGLNPGDTAAHRALDMTNNLVSSVGNLGSMNGLTICGWLNSANSTFRTTSTGRGNAVVNASLGGVNGGFVLAYRPNTAASTTYFGENGRLALCVNEWPADPLASQMSSLNSVPLSSNAVPANWIFFAVTYDGTLGANNLNYYFGSPTSLAALDPVSPQTYAKGVIAATGPLAVGNHNATPGDPNTAMPGNPTGRTVSGANGTMWRGLMDEIKIYNRVLTLAEIQAAQVSPAMPPYLLQQVVTNSTVLSWDGVWQLQSRTNLSSGNWINVTTPTNVSGTVRSLAIPPTAEAEYFRLRGQ